MYCIVSKEAVKACNGNRGKMLTQAGHAYVHANWNAQDSTNPITMGAFANFLNLEAYSNKSGVLHSGVPVVGGTTMVLNQNYATNAAVQTAMTGALQTTFVHYDCICTVKDGQLEVAF